MRDPSGAPCRWRAGLVVTLPGLVAAPAVLASEAHGSGFWARFGVLHPSLVHFPIALAITAAAAELAGLVFRIRALRDFAFVAVLLAGLAVVPVYLTGHAAHERKGRMATSLAARVERHEDWGTATMWVVLAAAGLALAARLRPRRFLRVTATAALLAAAALAGITGFFGAEVVRGPDHLSPLLEGRASPVAAFPRASFARER